jgi:hypothetical protein
MWLIYLKCQKKCGNTDLFPTAAPSPAKGRRRKLCNILTAPPRGVPVITFRRVLDLSVGRRFTSGEQLAVTWVVRGQTPGTANWQNIQPFESINNALNKTKKKFEPRNSTRSNTAVNSTPTDSYRLAKNIKMTHVIDTLAL